MLIKNGTIYTAVQREAFVGDILIQNGKITGIGQNLDAGGEEIFDAQGLNVYPGFVEAHCHIGLDGYGIGYEGADYNEYGDSVTPHLRAIDGIEPADPTLLQAAQAGVTTVCTGPGSANVLGGTFVAMKTIGRRVDEMIVRDNVAMKCAFGENPKRCYRDKGISTRMSTAAKLREALMKARQYKEKKDADKDPAFDFKSEALIPVLEGRMPLKAHAHQANDLFTAIRIAKEFGVKLTLEHCTEGHLVADLLAAEGLPMAVGPSLGHASKYELRKKSWATPGVLDKAGCKVSIITDSSVIPQKHLRLCAGLAIQAGMDPFHALQAITINPANHGGIADRVGSIEVGKDADIVVADGIFYEISTKLEYVFINGVSQRTHVQFHQTLDDVVLD